MFIPLMILTPSQMIGTPDSFLLVAPASRTKSHLNPIMAANNRNEMPKGFTAWPAPMASRRNASNARSNMITVAAILVIIVSLRHTTIHCATLKIHAPFLALRNVHAECPMPGAGIPVAGSLL